MRPGLSFGGVFPGRLAIPSAAVLDR
ncbi:hypothetical protein BOS5A_200307 [Bosea sp. EC-HK365B]|nr:hypothetical protein BOSE21B_100307 [Bosea sp. 21B]CAD5284391.1 hypothetical protein BOSE7B_41223 [Bosea sp. 7B]VVT57858.1 hypothetical protein BOS5A_200307 [Bosea sp. EC-HK365B]VXC91415.1 hypothetical protein BOSE127_80004 [Bosea sp. 127]